MNFILVGSDPAALEFVREADARGHRMLAYVAAPSNSPAPPLQSARRLDRLDQIADVAKVDYLVLSGSLAGRADRLRYVLRLDPVDLVLAAPLAATPDVYYELSLVQSETHVRVIHLALEAAHPAVARIVTLLRERPFGAVRWIEWTHPISPRAAGEPRYCEGWIWLQALVGRLVEVTATGAGEDPTRAPQVIVSARTGSGVLATARWLASDDSGHRLKLETQAGAIDCQLPESFSGPACLHCSLGEDRFVEQVRAGQPGRIWLDQWAAIRQGSLAGRASDAAAEVEIGHAVERSLANRRTVSLAQEEITGEAAFKSIMTSAGCGLIWCVILIAILVAAGVPYVGYAVLPLLVVFLATQLFGLVFRKPSPSRAYNPDRR